MTRLRKFLNSPSVERILLLHADILLWAVRLGLWVLPFQTLRYLCARVSPPMQNIAPVSPDRLVWAVKVASRYVPAATCLTQALAAQVLFGRRGHQARLQIGVRRGEERELQAHAWLEWSGRMVIGESDVERYTSLLTVER